MLRVAEQYAVTDTGRQRRANEDSLLARSPLFVVADGMGGAQAGEVASRIAVEYFQPGLGDASQPERELAELARAANSRIHELSHSNAEQAGMGTTLTAVYVGEDEVAIAHVGDSRAYCLRDGELLRLTDDHSLVDELMRQGRLTPEEAVEHPQRSVITRALGPEGAVEVDTRSYRARAGDVYLLCSDGLTTMLSEEEILALLLGNPRLRDAGEALIGAANEAGGRDNITVVLMRLEEVRAGQPRVDEHDTMTGVPAVPRTASTRTSRRPRTGPTEAAAASPASRRRRMRRAGASAIAVLLLGLIGAGGYLALQSVYFIGTNARGLVTLYRGVPFRLPGNVPLFTSHYVSGVSASSLTPQRRRTMLDHSLRSESNAASLIRSLELGQLE
ncbi:MAG: protein serine/threonine phosphatase [Solirubrobacterales bacterium]|jgi:serine/threonine protein phosphatase PrpC|nr:protein serine/threonine phosphatase [Solirubrobacterales bacterium]